MQKNIMNMEQALYMRYTIHVVLFIRNKTTMCMKENIVGCCFLKRQRYRTILIDEQSAN